MIRRTLYLAVLILSLYALSGCGYIARYDGPYKGRVIDAETGKPIEGVVALGVWYTHTPTPAGSVSAYYDAAETVTDKNGDFEIPGKGLKIFSTVGQINITIFKSGYQSIRNPWITFKVDESMSKKVSWEGNKVIISIRKLTMEERGKQGSPDYPSEAPMQKVTHVLKEINKDRIERGLKPVN